MRSELALYILHFLDRVRYIYNTFFIRCRVWVKVRVSGSFSIGLFIYIITY